ncbi:phosphate ABC transporter permease subunit PstC [Neomegalonema sp.]|uniref:phosphate ABC transporter permease subunit PstC n=1 Tax=Neomegalonema sp. TaxID=2039713 RepID=UPI00262F79E7|nr:phosphate ABC transporter permease subunit PstC [Neomegalonema sp.]MDD2868099.1 phosphate ABC transporter permease subunit PstC [Neomegalonema sp.]
MFGLMALILAVLTIAAYVLGRRRATAAAGGDLSVLHSRPVYHGAYAALLTFLAAFAAAAVAALVMRWFMDGSLNSLISDLAPSLSSIERDLVRSDAAAISVGGFPSRVDELRRAVAERHGTLAGLSAFLIPGLSIAAGLAALWTALRRVNADFRARNLSERIVMGVLIAAAVVAILTTVGILTSLIGETARFFSQIPVHKFLFGSTWSPLSGVFEGRLDQERVGALPLFAGTLLITFIAMLVALPIGLFAAIYLAEYASPRMRSMVKPILEILAGVPTVVYGFFAAITVAPIIRGLGETLGLSVASESALGAGLVMGVMIIPFISSLSDDVITAVPQALRDGSLGLGSTHAETIRKVVLPAALPGLVSAALLGFARAIGETMIVVMAAGQGANFTFNPLEAVTTVTVQIVMLITGDTEASTAAGPAFALGFTLFVVTLGFNIVAQRLVRKYREAYD